MLKNVFITLLLLLALVIGWHILLPLLGGAVALGAISFVFLSVFITGLCIAILLAFLFSGIGIFILGIFAFVGTIAAIVFFPIMFPILIPLFIIFLFVSYHRRKHCQKPTQQEKGSDEK